VNTIKGKTGRCFKHCERTWGCASQPSDLGYHQAHASHWYFYAYIKTLFPQREIERGRGTFSGQ
jgi:hypothetical protein